MLNHQHELSLPRVTAAPTTTSTAFFNTPVSVAAGLVKFLRMDPWAYYCCGIKDCDCKFLGWKFSSGKSRTCECCGHRSFFHFSYFNKHIIKPIANSGFSGAGLGSPSTRGVSAF